MDQFERGFREGCRVCADALRKSAADLVVVSASGNVDVAGFAAAREFACTLLNQAADIFSEKKETEKGT